MSLAQFGGIYEIVKVVSIANHHQLLARPCDRHVQTIDTIQKSHAICVPYREQHQIGFSTLKTIHRRTGTGRMVVQFKKRPPWLVALNSFFQFLSDALHLIHIKTQASDLPSNEAHRGDHEVSLSF